MPRRKRTTGGKPRDRDEAPLSTEERSSPGSGEDLQEDAADLQPDDVEGDEPAR
jgi:hypothetical protein